jgi:hypothetical protein
MSDNDLIMLYDIVKDLDLNDEQKTLVKRFSIIVEQINLSHEYRDKLNVLQNKMKEVDTNVER